MKNYSEKKKKGQKTPEKLWVQKHHSKFWKCWYWVCENMNSFLPMMFTLHWTDSLFLQWYSFMQNTLFSLAKCHNKNINSSTSPHLCSMDIYAGPTFILFKWSQKLRLLLVQHRDFKGLWEPLVIFLQTWLQSAETLLFGWFC